MIPIARFDIAARTIQSPMTMRTGRVIMPTTAAWAASRTVGTLLKDIGGAHPHEQMTLVLIDIFTPIRKDFLVR